MEYISHEEFKGFMSKLQASTPKGMLQEIHKLEHDGANEFHKLPADLKGSGMNEDFERPDAREMEEEEELGRITDVVYAVFAKDDITSERTIDSLAEDIRNEWSRTRGFGKGGEIDFAVEYLKDWVSDARSEGDLPGLGGGSKLSRGENNTIWGDDWVSVIDNAADSLSEGNAFTAGLAKAKKGEKFKVGDKTFKDKSNYDASLKEEVGDKVSISTKAINGKDGKRYNVVVLYQNTRNGLVGTPFAFEKPFTFTGTVDQETDKIANVKLDPGYEDVMATLFIANPKDGQHLKGDPELLSQVYQIHKGYTGFKKTDLKSQSSASMEEANYTDNYEGSWGYREGAEEETSGGHNMHDPETVAKVVAQKHGSELKPLFDKYQASYEEYMKSIKDPKADRLTLSKAHNAIVKAFQNKVINLAGNEMLQAGLKKTEVGNLLSGYGYFEDWLSDYVSAINKELKGVADNLNEGANYEDPYTLAKAVAEAHPELERLKLEDRKMFQRAAFKYAAEFMRKAGISNTAQINLINGFADEDWPSDYISALGKELEGMQEEVEEGLNEFGGESHTADNPKLQAAAKYLVQNRDKYLTQDYWTKHGIRMLSVKSDEELYDYIVNNIHSDGVYDTVAHMKSEMEEGLNMPPLQPTGQTIVTNEDQAPYGFSVLSPDERKQLREYINSVKTIKKEISKLLEKAGKSGKIMEDSRQEEDENVPAERKPEYHNPTKKSKPGGNRTNLVMTKAEMFEGEGHEHPLNSRLHDTFNKVTDLAIKQLVADGMDPMEAVSFLKDEIERKAKEATMSQYDF